MTLAVSRNPHTSLGLPLAGDAADHVAHVVNHEERAVRTDRDPDRSGRFIDQPSDRAHPAARRNFERTGAFARNKARGGPEKADSDDGRSTSE